MKASRLAAGIVACRVIRGRQIETEHHTVTVKAPRDIVLGFASDPALLAGWSNDYYEFSECAISPGEGGAKVVRFYCHAIRGGDRADWTLTLSASREGKATDVTATITGNPDRREADGRRIRRLHWPWWRAPSGLRRAAVLEHSLARLTGFAESAALSNPGKPRPAGGELTASDMVALLGVYAGQYGSYTSLLWQVPALGLTAQAFLMTIVLGTGGDGTRYVASALSAIIAYASIHLLHNQRARAINHAELAKRISYRLSLTTLVGGTFSINDASPRFGTDTQNVWAINRIIYRIWAGCLVLFICADAAVSLSLATGGTWLA
jgi:hypothetical protein